MINLCTRASTFQIYLFDVQKSLFFVKNFFQSLVWISKSFTNPEFFAFNYFECFIFMLILLLKCIFGSNSSFFIYNLVVMQRASQNLGHHEFPGVCFIRFSLCVCVWVFSRCGLLWKDTEREKRDREKGVWWIDKLPTPLTTLFGNWQQQTRSPRSVRVQRAIVVV